MAMVRRSRDEWAVVVDALGKSRLPAREFAGKHGINVNTLLWWRSELRRERPTRQAVAFVEVVVAEPAEDRPAAPLIVVLRGVRHEIIVPSGFDGAELRRLVDALC